MAAAAQDFFVAGLFALFNETRADPPDKRMEPENRFDDQMNRSEEIVATTDMAEFVRENGFQLRRRQPLCNSFGEQEDRTQNAYYSRPQMESRHANLYRVRNGRRSAGADCCPDPEPAPKSDEGRSEERRVGKEGRSRWWGEE